VELGLSPGDFVSDGDPVPLPKKGAEPRIFGPCILWPNGRMYQDTTWCRGRHQPKRHCLRWGPSSPPLKAHSPQFWANVRCGQTAEWTKMPLVIEVGFGPGDFVFYEVPAPPRKKGTAPTQFFSPCLHLHTTTVLRLFFQDYPAETGARREFLDFMMQGKINRGRHTDHPAGRHCIRTNQCPPPPSPHIFTGRMPFLPPNQQRQSTEGD